MRVLTLQQPYATLVALGLKTIETRGKRTHVRGRIAIHAAAAPPGARARAALDGLTLGPIRMCLDLDRGWIEHYGAGTTGMLWGDDGYAPTPFGAIVATADLHDCIPIIGWGTCSFDSEPHVCAPPPDALYRHEPMQQVLGRPLGPSEFDHTAERPFGDYTPGRWAWLLRDVEPVSPPVPFTGGQMWSRTWDGAR